MAPEFSPHQLTKTKPLEYVVRFAFGGVISVIAWMIGKAFGPGVGGLFLAFPAILPASLTLVKEHDGRRAAADDARGASLGSLGLSAFGLTVWATADWRRPWFTLGLALLLWLAVSVAAWWIVLKKPTNRGGAHDRCRPGGGAEPRRPQPSQ